MHTGWRRLIAPPVTKPEEFLKVSVIYVSPADVRLWLSYQWGPPFTFTFSTEGIMRQQGKGGGFGLIYVVGGSNPSRLATVVRREFIHILSFRLVQVWAGWLWFASPKRP